MVMGQCDGIACSSLFLIFYTILREIQRSVLQFPNPFFHESFVSYVAYRFFVHLLEIELIPLQISKFCDSLQ